jgi:hypothetical protein
MALELYSLALSHTTTTSGCFSHRSAISAIHLFAALRASSFVLSPYKHFKLYPAWLSTKRAPQKYPSIDRIVDTIMSKFTYSRGLVALLAGPEHFTVAFPNHTRWAHLMHIKFIVSKLLQFFGVWDSLLDNLVRVMHQQRMS